MGPCSCARSHFKQERQGSRPWALMKRDRVWLNDWPACWVWRLNWAVTLIIPRPFCWLRIYFPHARLSMWNFPFYKGRGCGMVERWPLDSDRGPALDKSQRPSPVDPVETPSLIPSHRVLIFYNQDASATPHVVGKAMVPTTHATTESSAGLSLISTRIRHLLERHFAHNPERGHSSLPDPINTLCTLESASALV
jgi:hypothetical protein